MSVAIPQGESSQTELSILNNQSGATIPATFGDKTFTSDNTAVFGVKVGSAPQTIELQITGPGKANMTISTPSTFLGPVSGKIVTFNKSKTLPINVTQNGADFVVEIG